MVLAPEEARCCPRFNLKQALLSILRLPLFCFLVFYIATNLIGIQTNSIKTVTTCPKMNTPIRFLLQFSKLVEYTNRCSTLNDSDTIRNK